VIHNLDFQIPEGKVVGFLGANGAGKTTTMKTILGMLFKDSGKFFFRGREVASLAGANMSGVSAMIEEPAFHDYLTGRENLFLVSDLRGGQRADIDEVLNKVGLQDSADRKFREYSTGMGQRLSMAACLLSGRELMLLDEPTNGLDPSGQSDMRRLVRTLAADGGMTIFISSHMLHEVEQLCDFVIIIHDGRLVVQGLVSELLAQNHETYEIVLSSADDVQKADEFLKKARGVNSVESGLSNGQPSFVVKVETGTGSALLSELVSRGIALTGFIPSKRSLEDFYLQVVSHLGENGLKQGAEGEVHE
jgi:ABC-2 type transport system ATP-binding protein